jgi:hypothetical protein
MVIPLFEVGGKRPVKLMPAKRGLDTSKLPRAAGAGLQKHHHGSEDRVPASLGGRGDAELRDLRDPSKKTTWRTEKDLQTPVLSIMALARIGEDCHPPSSEASASSAVSLAVVSSYYFLSSPISKKLRKYSFTWITGRYTMSTSRGTISPRLEAFW